MVIKIESITNMENKKENEMEMTVKSVFDELAQSSGFVLFGAFTKVKEDGTVSIESRYMRQQFVPEDLDKVFENFRNLLSEDIAKSGGNLLKMAEGIANNKFPSNEISGEGHIDES